MIEIHESFPRYEQYDPKVPVWCVTPDEGRIIHRFFDTSPFSPSGRYMALFRLPQEERLPEPGEKGEVILVDLATGEETVLAETRGWEPQMGANINWGADDTELFFNDVNTSDWTPFGVRVNPITGEHQRLGGCIYHVSPDGRKALSANMATMRRTQNGYGVVIPDAEVRSNPGLVEDDGLYITDTRTGECELLLSIKDCVQRATPASEFADATGLEVYGFHCKWNAEGNRVMFSLRAFPGDGTSRFGVMREGALRFDVYTLTPDADEICLAVPASEWEKGGHHTTWCPDGQTLSMNLNIHEDGLRFVQVNYDGSGLSTILDEPAGSGHPTVHPNGQHILTDDYVWGPAAFGDGTVPIRLVDRHTGEDTTLVRLRTQTEQQGQCPALRVDPHPAWDPTYSWVAFNGYVDGTRRVYVADMRDYVD
ncbi:MAG: TolB family protein [Planctomycetota bacterium]